MAEPASATIHLVTILYNSAAGLPDFLDSLQAQDMTGWQLHAIDNASPDGSGDLVAARADPRLGVLRNSTNLGFAKAVNIGLCAAVAAGGDFLILINNDTEFEPDFLRRLLAARETSHAQVIAPRVMRRDQPDKSWYSGGTFDHGWLFTNIHQDYHPTDAPRIVEFAPGCCLGIDRAVLERVGLLDESFFVYWEDTDFCLRLKAHGVPIQYVTEPSLLHDGGASSGGEFSPTYLRLYYRSYMQLLRKHFGLPHAIRSMLRVVLDQNGQPNRDARRMRLMAQAMLRGLVAPLVKQVGLTKPRSANNP